MSDGVNAACRARWQSSWKETPSCDCRSVLLAAHIDLDSSPKPLVIQTGLSHVSIGLMRCTDRHQALAMKMPLTGAG